MPRFSDLPLDLLPCILHHLSKEDYNSLIRVCRSLHKEVLPYLYQDIAFTARNSHRCSRRLAFLLRTLLERPQLARHVTVFRLFGSHYNWNKENVWSGGGKVGTVNLWGLEGVTILSKSQILLASNQFYQLVDEEMHKSLAQFRGRSKDALATLVLTRLTHLKTLEIGDGFLVHSLFLPQVLKRVDSLFPRLSHIIFGNMKRDLDDKTVSYMDLDLIRPVFYLSSVQGFEWKMAQPWQFSWKSTEAPRSESLSMLHLFRTNINRATLGHLLAATPNLKSLHYEQEILFNQASFGAPPIDQFINLAGLNAALSYVASSLEEVNISLCLAPGSLSPEELTRAGWEFPAIHGTLSILKSMKHLTKVDVPLVYFLGWSPDFAARLEEVLPTDITHLSLRDDLVSYCPWSSGFNCNKKIGLVGEYVETRSVHAPKLETLSVRLAATATQSFWLHHAVKALPMDGSRNVTSEEGTETHSWHFDSASKSSRKDSVVPPGSPLSNFSSRSHVLNNYFGKD